MNPYYLEENNELSIHHNLDSVSLKNNSTINNYKIGEKTINTSVDSLQTLYSLDNKTLFVIDSLGIYNVNSFKPEVILLRNSPKINLKRLIDSLKPELIISDGSNYKTYQERWLKTCETEKIPFHQTSKKGAFIIDY